MSHQQLDKQHKKKNVMCKNTELLNDKITVFSSFSS